MKLDCKYENIYFLLTNCLNKSFKNKMFLVFLFYVCNILYWYGKVSLQRNYNRLTIMK